MKKQFYMFIFMFLFLAIGMHFKQWTSHPIEHMMNISQGGAFGIPGIIHPLVFTILGYIVLLGLIKLFNMIFK
ncbi:MAG: hypothetical protein DRG11_07185 [Epsilonproteobacteria bacterium]|nr:MAG: hypothetical protein DRG11_07185 [Campylobacterota bacterium]